MNLNEPLDAAAARIRREMQIERIVSRGKYAPDLTEQKWGAMIDHKTAAAKERE
jgi:hypothetical protein